MERGEPANLLIAGNQHVLVDTGDGTVNDLARIGMDLSGIRTIFISHHHLDHTGGLGAVLGLRWMNQLPGKITVYGPPGTGEMVSGLLASFAPPARIGFGLGKAPPAPSDSVNVVEIMDGSVVDFDGGLKVTAAANSHFAHPGLVAPEDSQSLSYRFSFGSRAITFTGDTGPSVAIRKLASHSDLLVSEVIDLDELLAELSSGRRAMPTELLARIRTHFSTHHLSAEEVGRIARAASVRRVVLTHFAAPPGPLPVAKVLAGVHSTFAGPVAAARDLQRFDIGCS